MNKTEKKENLADKSRFGFMAMSLRSVLTNILQIASSYILAYYLTPGDYGEFGILSSFVGALLFLSDIGLSIHLQQKSEEISDQEFQSFFGIRILLALLLVAGFFIAQPFLIDHYKFNFTNPHLLGLYVLIIPFEVISSVPKLMLIRELEFKEIAKIDMASSVTLYLTQIILAVLGFGVWSFIIANLARQTVSLIMSYSIKKRIILPRFSFKTFDKETYKRGFFYQLNSIIPTSRGIFFPIILSLYLSVDEMGLMFWVIGLVSIPMVFAYNYNSVFLPALSKVHKSKEEAKHLSSRAIENMVLALGFIFGLGGTIGPNIIDIVFPDKWALARDLVPLAALYIGLSAVRFIGTTIINAQGRPHVLTKIEIALVIMEYLGIVIFCSKLGLKGYFISQVVIYFLCLLYVYINTKEWVRFEAIWRFFSVLSATLIPYFLIYFSILNINIFVKTFSYIFLFLFIILVLDKSSKSDIKKLVSKVLDRFS